MPDQFLYGKIPIWSYDFDASTDINLDDDEDTIRILLTTDNHVGYAEKDPIRGNDAAITFREVMNIARDYDVSFHNHTISGKIRIF